MCFKLFPPTKMNQPQCQHHYTLSELPRSRSMSPAPTLPLRFWHYARLHIGYRSFKAMKWANVGILGCVPWRWRGFDDRGVLNATSGRRCEGGTNATKGHVTLTATSRVRRETGESPVERRGWTRRALERLLARCVYRIAYR